MGLPLGSEVALVLLGLVGLAIYFMLGSFLFGAGYQPTPPAVLRRMMQFARISSADRVYDLGAGTGGLLFRALAEGPAWAVGVEIEPIRYWLLRLRRRGNPRSSRLELRREDLFAVDLRSATLVLTFLWPNAMARLREKFERELPAGARVVSYWHPIPGWKTEAVDVKLRVYAYRRPPT